MPSQSRYLSASEAAAALGVARATLYAYTSRGYLHSEAVPGRPRESRYDREEVQRLQQRKEARLDPSKAAAQGLHWGSPVLASGITLIHEGRLYYRGQDVLQLAAHANLEEAAALLWAAEPAETARLFHQPLALSPPRLARLHTLARAPLPLMQMALALAASTDHASHDLRPAAVRQTAARIVRLLTTMVAGRHAATSIHHALQSAWAPSDPPAAGVIRTALVLCADHELNVSAFTARCAASAGASPWDVVSAALATLKGRRHGGSMDRVTALFDEVREPRRARAVIAARLRQGDSIGGFGHPLYPAGDPRAAMLLKLAEAGPHRSQWRLARALANAGESLLHDRPNLDFSLVAVARCYAFPAVAPLVLFALGRTVGWMAHAIEEYAKGELIRPRALYTGPPPHD